MSSLIISLAARLTDRALSVLADMTSNTEVNNSLPNATASSESVLPRDIRISSTSSRTPAWIHE